MRAANCIHFCCVRDNAPFSETPTVPGTIYLEQGLRPLDRPFFASKEEIIRQCEKGVRLFDMNALRDLRQTGANTVWDGGWYKNTVHALAHPP